MSYVCIQYFDLVFCCEPDKCSAVEWFPLHGLPDDVIPYPLAGIRAYLDGVSFGLLGWTDNEQPAPALA